MNGQEATIEAWGVVDGQPTSKHFALRVYDEDGVCTGLQYVPLRDLTAGRWG